ncbi:NnrU family protein [Pelagibacterium xiamenense]|uniref:NnrU family protein n=1 Tax=Pelagibacterium xiamenense TaxID=2901140 RepID=UPI001E3620E4|nr:NnrU family protein [Pelagibacterium xiamenense]MCD7059756.1 NnrU family protein [Pelagibacterium xiamenense]
MWVLILGLVLFLGAHSVRIVAPAWRDAQIAERPGAFKGIYTLVSLVGLVLIIWGFGLARPETAFVFTPPDWGVHAASLLVILGFIGIAAAYLPAGRIKAWLKHPMVVGVALWALGHLLANGDLASLLLFGAFLLWAVVDRIAAGRRPDPVPQAGPVTNDLLAIVVGAAVGLVFALWLHAPLIGVAPFG